jgi:hypothetical protein
MNSTDTFEKKRATFMTDPGLIKQKQESRKEDSTSRDKIKSPRLLLDVIEQIIEKKSEKKVNFYFFSTNKKINKILPFVNINFILEGYHIR